MSRYFFGSFFVRFAKLIAALVFLAGIAGAAVRYAQTGLEAARIRYAPSASTGAKLFTLGHDWRRTKQLVTQFLGQSAPAMTDLSISNAPSTPAEFARVTAQLTAMQGERDAAKEVITRRFETLVAEIEGKLRVHASELAETPPEPAAETPKPRAKPPKVAEIPPPATHELKTLFDSLPAAEVASRRGLLTEGYDFISLLKASAENPENAATLGGALDELVNFERFLPPTLAITPKPPPQEKVEKAAPAALVRSKPNAERVADQLLQLRTMVRSALMTDWAIDRPLAQVAADVEAEQKLCLESARALKALWLNAAVFMAVIVVGAALAAFFVLVLADLGRASLDAANRASRLTAAIHSLSSETETIAPVKVSRSHES
jgi:hypothetical protein